MSLKRRTFENTLGALTSFFLNFGVRFAVSVFIIRLIAKRDLGSWQVINGFAQWVILLSGLGLHGTMLRDTLRTPRRGSEFWLHATAVRLALTAASGLVGVAGLALAHHLGWLTLVPQDWWLVAILFTGAFFPAIKASPVLEAHHRQNAFFVAQLGTSVLLLLALLFFVRVLQWESIVVYVVLQQGLGGLMEVMNVWYMHRNLSPIRWRFSVRRALRGARRSVVKGVEQFLSQSLQIQDKVCVGLLIGLAASAEYYVAISFCSIGTHFLLTLYRVFRPVLLEGAVRGDMAMLARRSATYLRVYGAFAMPLVVGSAMVSFTFIPYVYGSAYVAAIAPAAILSCASFALVYYTTFNDLIFSYCRDRQMLLTSGTAFAANLLLNLTLLPLLGTVGAAIATVCSYGLGALVAGRVVARYAPIPVTRHLLKPLAACIPMAGALHFLMDFNVFLQIGAGAIVYALALLPQRHFTADEYALLFRGPLAPLRRRVPTAAPPPAPPSAGH